MKVRNEIQTRVAVVESEITHINNALERIENKLNAIDQKSDINFNNLNSKIDKTFFWTVGLILSLLGTAIVSMIFKNLHLTT